MLFFLGSMRIAEPLIPSWVSRPGLQLQPFIAELILVATVLALLIGALRTGRSNTAAAIISLAGLLLAAVALILVQPLPQGLQLRGMLVSDNLAVFWKILLLLFAAGIVLLWFSSVAATMHPGDGPEFFTLLLGATTGMCLMASTSNLLMIFIAVELASLPSYVLAGFRKTERLGSEASLKYVLFGAACSAVMVYGLSMLYGLYGTLQLEELAPMLNLAGGVPLIVALAGILVGTGFKISAVPFHFWCPDVFEGAGIDVAAFLSVASKGAGLVLLLRILMIFAYSPLQPDVALLRPVAILLGVLAAVTCTLGNTAAYVQSNIKRLLAYSSIAHAGYMLCAMSLLVAAGDVPAPASAAGPAAQALLLYLAVYLFMNLGAFTVAGLIHRAEGTETIDDYAGLSRRNPLLAACFASCLFSLVGLPPFAGFAAKLNLMYVLAANGSWWWALVAVIGVNTVFSLYYYLRIVRVMYLLDSGKPAMPAHPVGSALAVLCAALLVVMLLAFNPLLRLTGQYAQLHLAPARPGSSALVQTD